MRQSDCQVGRSPCSQIKEARTMYEDGSINRAFSVVVNDDENLSYTEAFLYHLFKFNPSC